MQERGATEEEACLTVREGERFDAKLSRTGFRRNFACRGTWRGNRYSAKQVEAIAEKEGSGWLVVTVVVRYF
jgi:hypothetical protein